MHVVYSDYSIPYILPTPSMPPHVYQSLSQDHDFGCYLMTYLSYLHSIGSVHWSLEGSPAGSKIKDNNFPVK